MNISLRALFVCITLLVVGGLAKAGNYQRTTDGQALVWNNYPKPDDQAAWSGRVDQRGYATGQGTLTWYKRSVFVSRYSGTMVQGKLDGSITNEDANGKMYRGTFVNGNKSSDWVQTGGSSTVGDSGRGIYQKTYDGKALIWNNYPKPDDQAAWQGDVDLEGYAAGEGKLAWYKNRKLVSVYVGTMVRGKWDGVVINEDADGKRFQGTFTDGIKSGDWAQVAEFRRVVSPSQMELNNHWATYLKEIQDDNDYANWSERPSDLYAKRK